MTLLHPAPGFKAGDRYGERASNTVNGYKTSPMHGGLDLVPLPGQPRTVVAAADGEVVRSPYNASAGNAVCIAHDGLPGIEATGYAHLALELVGVGARVRAGQPIGVAGSTGASSGPHLHFDVFADLSAFIRIDPYPLIDWSDPMSWTNDEKLEVLTRLRSIDSRTGALRDEQIEEDGIAQRTLAAATETRDALLKPNGQGFKPINILTTHVQKILRLLDPKA